MYQNCNFGQSNDGNITAWPLSSYHPTFENTIQMMINLVNLPTYWQLVASVYITWHKREPRSSISSCRNGLFHWWLLGINSNLSPYCHLVLFQLNSPNRNLAACSFTLEHLKRTANRMAVGCTLHAIMESLLSTGQDSGLVITTQANPVYYISHITQHFHLHIHLLT